MSSSRTRLGLTIAVLAVLTGCASVTPNDASPEVIVQARAQARWDALIKGEFDKAYAYLSPGSRTVTSLAQFRASFGGAVAWKRVEVIKVTCEASEKCIARVRIEHEPVLLRGRLGTIDTHMDETWIADAGQWWQVHTL